MSISREVENQFADWLRGYDSDQSATPNQAAMKLAKFAANLLEKPMDGRVIPEALFQTICGELEHCKHGLSDFLEEFRAAPHAQASEGGWISVKERLPELGEHVLVCRPDSPKTVRKIHFIVWSEGDEHDFTHWQKCPDFPPPQPEKGKA